MKREWKCQECGKTIGKRYSFCYCYDCAYNRAGYFRVFNKMVYFGSRKKYDEYLDKFDTKVLQAKKVKEL